MVKLVLDCLLLLPLLIIFLLESLLKSFIPKKRKSVTGEIVLITGAGHGIGRLTAYEFAKLKSKLVLWDINKVIVVLYCFSFLVPLLCGHVCMLQATTPYSIAVKEEVEKNYYCQIIDRGGGGKHGLINVFMIV